MFYAFFKVHAWILRPILLRNPLYFNSTLYRLAEKSQWSILELKSTLKDINWKNKKKHRNSIFITKLVVIGKKNIFFTKSFEYYWDRKMSAKNSSIQQKRTLVWYLSLPKRWRKIIKLIFYFPPYIQHK